ncbi:hypothetical protein Tco_1405181 [Tanacetum coccineum]
MDEKGRFGYGGLRRKGGPTETRLLREPCPLLYFYFEDPSGGGHSGIVKGRLEKNRSEQYDLGLAPLDDLEEKGSPCYYKALQLLHQDTVAACPGDGLAPFHRTSVPEAKKEEQEQEVVLSRPSSSATTTVVVANGDPPFRKVTGPAVRSKVVCHSYGADRFTTSAPLSDISG